MKCVTTAGSIKSYYIASTTSEFQILFRNGEAQPPGSGAPPDFTLLEGNKNRNWGEIDKIEYRDASGTVVKEEDYQWIFKGHADDDPDSLIHLATVAQPMPYNGGASSTPEIRIDFAHKQLDSKVTKFKGGHPKFSFPVDFAYMLAPIAADSSSGKQNKTKVFKQLVVV